MVSIRSGGPSAAQRRLLIAEPDARFAEGLQRSFQCRGYQVAVASSIEQVNALLHEVEPQFAIVELKLGGGSGLCCVKQLHEHNAEMKVVVLTGYASISTAVEAIKLGACHYLAKPSNVADIEAAFERAPDGDVTAPISPKATSLKNLEWERINETLSDTGFNISETARRLGLHRRTLARKLAKRPVP